MKESIVKNKSYLFAIKIVRLYQFICEKRKEFTLAKQILRAGTSIGVMVREAEQAESKADFIHKLSVALKEANETDYWLNILKDTQYIDEKTFVSMDDHSKEVIALLVSIIKKSKQNIK